MSVDEANCLGDSFKMGFSSVYIQVAVFYVAICGQKLHQAQKTVCFYL